MNIYQTRQKRHKSSPLTHTFPLDGRERQGQTYAVNFMFLCLNVSTLDPTVGTVVTTSPRELFKQIQTTNVKTNQSQPIQSPWRSFVQFVENGCLPSRAESNENQFHFMRPKETIPHFTQEITHPKRTVGLIECGLLR
jgi:hypothetical protein